MQVILLGVSHRTAPVELRERLDFSSRDLGAAVQALALRPSAAETVVLSTCNRSEIYVVCNDPVRAREEVADEYLDILRDPLNVNRLRYFDLQSFPNVSPIDAVAIVEARKRAGQIENERQLRSSDGLSNWGFRNLRRFLVYEDPVGRGELSGRVTLLSFDKPYRLDDGALLTEPLPRPSSA